MHFVLYYPEEKAYSRLLTWAEARKLAKEFIGAILIDMRTGEVLN
jgi:hypothetical protein